MIQQIICKEYIKSIHYVGIFNLGDLRGLLEGDDDFSMSELGTTGRLGVGS